LFCCLIFPSFPFPDYFVVSPKLLQCASWLRCREQCAVSAQRRQWLNGCSSGSPLLLLTAEDSNVPALTMRMVFWTLRVVHEPQVPSEGHVKGT
jgi:hypothetical protein